MEPAVIVTKGGSVMYSRVVVSNPAGECGGQTEGAIRALVAAGRRVVVFGRWHGPGVPGAVHVDPHIDGLEASSPARLQRELWDLDAAALEPYAPFALMLEVSGPPHAMSTIDNPTHSRVQNACVRYRGPQLNVLHRFHLPRIVACVDPTAYPNEQEMTLTWPECRPAALLDHRTREWDRVVGGSLYACRSVAAGLEAWNYDEPISAKKTVACVCVAHPHLDRTAYADSLDIAWGNLLGRPRPAGFRCFGKGWNAFSGYDGDEFIGSITVPQARRVLASAACCPVLAHTPGHFGTKQWFALSSGCVPLSYGDDRSPHCWDSDEKYLPMDHWSRVSRPGQLADVSEQMFADPVRLEFALGELREIFKPDYSQLLEIVEQILDGRPIGDGSWWTDWGGYRPC